MNDRKEVGWIDAILDVCGAFLSFPAIALTKLITWPCMFFGLLLLALGWFLSLADRGERRG